MAKYKMVIADVTQEDIDSHYGVRYSSRDNPLVFALRRVGFRYCFVGRPVASPEGAPFWIPDEVVHPSDLKMFSVTLKAAKFLEDYNSGAKVMPGRFAFYYDADTVLTGTDALEKLSALGFRMSGEEEA